MLAGVFFLQENEFQEKRVERMPAIKPAMNKNCALRACVQRAFWTQLRPQALWLEILTWFQPSSGAAKSLKEMLRCFVKKHMKTNRKVGKKARERRPKWTVSELFGSVREYWGNFLGDEQLQFSSVRANLGAENNRKLQCSQRHLNENEWIQEESDTS